MNPPNRRSLLIACFIGLVIISVLIGRITAHPIASLAQNPNTNAPSSPAATAPEWKPIEQAMGKSGTMQPGDVFKFGLPRTDLQVIARSVPIKPTFALGSWVAFKKMGNEAMVMGDLVLTQDEITPVMTKLQSGGIEQTALHNHYP